MTPCYLELASLQVSPGNLLGWEETQAELRTQEQHPKPWFGAEIEESNVAAPLPSREGLTSLNSALGEAG